MLILRVDDPTSLKEVERVARRIVAAAEDGSLRTVRMWLQDRDPSHDIGPTFEVKVNDGMWTSPIAGEFEQRG